MGNRVLWLLYTHCVLSDGLSNLCRRCGFKTTPVLSVDLSFDPTLDLEFGLAFDSNTQQQHCFAIPDGICLNLMSCRFIYYYYIMYGQEDCATNLFT